MTEVLLFHDDARPLTNVHSSEAMTYFGWVVLLLHVPNGPDVTPSHWMTVCEDTVVQMMRYCRMSCASIRRGWGYRVTVHTAVQWWEETVGKEWDCQLFTVTNISVWLTLFLIVLWTNDSLNFPLLMIVTVLTVLLLRIRVFWGVMLCHWLRSSSRFEVLWCLYLWGQVVHSFWNAWSLKMNTRRFFITLETPHPVKNNHIPEDLIPPLGQFMDTKLLQYFL